MDSPNQGQASLPATANAPAIGQTSASSRIAGAMLALALGISIISAVGFLQGPNAVLHNAAHDTRHAFAFPCH